MAYKVSPPSAGGRLVDTINCRNILNFPENYLVNCTYRVAVQTFHYIIHYEVLCQFYEAVIMNGIFTVDRLCTNEVLNANKCYCISNCLPRFGIINILPVY